MAVQHAGDEYLSDWGQWYCRVNDKSNPHDRSSVNMIYRLMREAEGHRYREESRNSNPLSDLECEQVDNLVLTLGDLNQLILLHFYPFDMSVRQVTELVSDAGFSVSKRTVERRLNKCRVEVYAGIQEHSVIASENYIGTTCGVCFV